MKNSLNLSNFRRRNIFRAAEIFKIYNNIPDTYWTTALAGEVGELCNLIKKIERVTYGGPDSGTTLKSTDITKEMIKQEIGDIFIYLDLLAARLGISLEEAIIDTFNNKSNEIGCKVMAQE